jgi:hypothetical protein
MHSAWQRLCGQTDALTLPADGQNCVIAGRRGLCGYAKEQVSAHTVMATLLPIRA